MENIEKIRKPKSVLWAYNLYLIGLALLVVVAASFMIILFIFAYFADYYMSDIGGIFAVFGVVTILLFVFGFIVSLIGKFIATIMGNDIGKDHFGYQINTVVLAIFFAICFMIYVLVLGMTSSYPSLLDSFILIWYFFAFFIVPFRRINSGKRLCKETKSPYNIYKYSDTDMKDVEVIRKSRSVSMVFWLYFFAPLSCGITAIVGVIIAYVLRDDVEELWKDHFRWLINSFWILLLPSIAQLIMIAVAYYHAKLGLDITGYLYASLAAAIVGVILLFWFVRRLTRERTTYHKGISPYKKSAK